MPKPSTHQTALPRKNALLNLDISDVNADGFGIGRSDGYAVFADGALPGEKLRVRLLKVKPAYAYAKIEKIFTPSPHRVNPPCPVAGRCGGCQFQHCGYPAQLALKKRMVTDALTRIGQVPESGALVSDVRGMDDPFYYRNKAQFPIAPSAKGAALPDIGFYAPRSHRIVPVDECRIHHRSHVKVLEVLRRFLARYPVPAYDEVSHSGLLRHVVVKTSFATGEIMVVLVINGVNFPHEKELAGQLTQEAGAATVLVNRNTQKTNVIWGDYFRTLTGSGHIHEKIGDIEYRLSPGAFFQVNTVQAEVLYETALAFGAFQGGETVIDAHAGIGGVALPATRQAGRVLGVDIVPQAVKDAEYNAALNGVANARFVRGSAEEAVPELLRGQPVHAVFLDPPRKGCGKELLSAIVAASVPKVIYISCDPATLARDVRILREGGYTLNKVQPVDLFPMTGHVECVAGLTRIGTISAGGGR